MAGDGELEKMDEERVHMSDVETRDEVEESQNGSLAEKVEAYRLGMTLEPIFSSRLATKNPEKIPILEKAKM